MIDWQDLLRALALVMVIEGILPFVSPHTTRRTLVTVLQLPDRALRVAGLVSMLAGAAVLLVISQ